ncbi:DUF4214 domain-containing protein [Clostridium sp. YIM B02515]|uniref:DUF4214 domain-containing protein n=1 Tax=Clostridium rhizosphaerae TaxID=2803861 RepID=A0ABS1TDL7_9CLOT|nr:DUF4214 domain-containing protein [Clostridium rhizosphaerae]
MYRLFFDRAADTSGQNYWQGKLTNRNSRKYDIYI